MYALPPATGRSSIIRVTHTPLIHRGPRTPRTSSTQHGAPSIYSITKLSLLYCPCCFAQYCILHTANRANPCLQIKLFDKEKRLIICSHRVSWKVRLGSTKTLHLSLNELVTISTDKKKLKNSFTSYPVDTINFYTQIKRRETWLNTQKLG